MPSKYTHLKLNEDYATGIAGYYTPQEEVKLEYNGREVLHVIGRAVIEASCCGVGSWTYNTIPGYIVDWQNSKNEDGLAVSEVEPITDETARANIRRLITTSDPDTLIGFW